MDKRKPTIVATAALMLVIIATAFAVVMLQRQLTVHHEVKPRIFELWSADETVLVTQINYTFWTDQVSGLDTNQTIVKAHNTDLNPAVDLKITCYPDSDFNSSRWNLYIWCNGHGAWQTDDDLYIMTETNTTGQTALCGYVAGGNITGSWLTLHIFYWPRAGYVPDGDVDFNLIWDAEIGDFVP